MSSALLALALFILLPPVACVAATWDLSDLTVQFAERADRGLVETGTAQAAVVDPAIITRLGLLVAPSLLVLNLAGVAALYFYRIDQKTHEDNVSRIAAASGS